MDPIPGILEILDRAAMTGTNKLGLLLTLIDLAPALEGDAPSVTQTRIAQRYLEIHWEHARPYPYGGRTFNLRQSSARKRRSDGTVADDTTVMQEIRGLRDLLECGDRGDLQEMPLEIVERRLDGTDLQTEWKQAYETALAKVRANLLRNPVRLLQRLPGDPDPFLYDMTGDKTALTFLPGVARSLTRFAGVLRPLIEFRFAQAVMRINRETLQLPIDDVYSHLFGRDRIMPSPKMRQGLVEIQRGRCIFTDIRLPTTGGSLDHVVPWSRARLSQIENFVMTTPSVNSSKSDSLPAPAAMERWFQHIDTNSGELQQCADEHGWLTDLDSVRRVALHIYRALDASTGVWDFEHGIQLLGVDGKRAVLELLSSPASST